MKLYKLTFKGQSSGIPKGFEMQVPSVCTPEPNSREIHEAIVRNGFSEDVARRLESSGNWYVKSI